MTYQSRKEQRRLIVELLESRTMLDSDAPHQKGPELDGVELFDYGQSTGTVELQFASEFPVDEGTLAGAIRVTDIGADRLTNTHDDTIVPINRITPSTQSRGVIVNFQTPPTPYVVVTILGTGTDALRDIEGNAFNDPASDQVDNGADEGVLLFLTPNDVLELGRFSPITLEAVQETVSGDARHVVNDALFFTSVQAQLGDLLAEVQGTTPVSDLLTDVSETVLAQDFVVDVGPVLTTLDQGLKEGDVLGSVGRSVIASYPFAETVELMLVDGNPELDFPALLGTEILSTMFQRGIQAPADNFVSVPTAGDTANVDLIRLPTTVHKHSGGVSPNSVYDDSDETAYTASTHCPGSGGCGVEIISTHLFPGPRDVSEVSVKATAHSYATGKYIRDHKGSLTVEYLTGNGEWLPVPGLQRSYSGGDGDSRVSISTTVKELALTGVRGLRVIARGFGNASGGEGNAGADVSISNLSAVGPPPVEPPIVRAAFSDLLTAALIEPVSNPSDSSSESGLSALLAPKQPYRRVIVDEANIGNLDYSGESRADLSFKRSADDLLIYVDRGADSVSVDQFKNYFAHPRNEWTITSDDGVEKLDAVAEIPLHVRAQQAVNSYKDPDSFDAPVGWELVERINGSLFGFTGLEALFYKTDIEGRYELAIRGTQFLNVATDVRSLRMGGYPQARELIPIVERLMEEHDVSELYIDGHSQAFQVGTWLGAFLAPRHPDLTLIVTGFNGLGAADYIPQLKEIEYPNLRFVNVVSECDFATPIAGSFPKGTEFLAFPRAEELSQVALIRAIQAVNCHRVEADILPTLLQLQRTGDKLPEPLTEEQVDQLLIRQQDLANEIVATLKAAKATGELASLLAANPPTKVVLATIDALLWLSTDTIENLPAVTAANLQTHQGEIKDAYDNQLLVNTLEIVETSLQKVFEAQSGDSGGGNPKPGDEFQNQPLKLEVSDDLVAFFLRDVTSRIASDFASNAVETFLSQELDDLPDFVASRLTAIAKNVTSSVTYDIAGHVVKELGLAKALSENLLSPIVRSVAATPAYQALNSAFNRLNPALSIIPEAVSFFIKVPDTDLERLATSIVLTGEPITSLGLTAFNFILAKSEAKRADKFRRLLESQARDMGVTLHMRSFIEAYFAADDVKTLALLQEADRDLAITDPYDTDRGGRQHRLGLNAGRVYGQQILGFLAPVPSFLPVPQGHQESSEGIAQQIEYSIVSRGVAEAISTITGKTNETIIFEYYGDTSQALADGTELELFAKLLNARLSLSGGRTSTDVNWVTQPDTVHRHDGPAGHEAVFDGDLSTAYTQSVHCPGVGGCGVHLVSEHEFARPISRVDSIAVAAKAHSYATGKYIREHHGSIRVEYKAVGSDWLPVPGAQSGYGGGDGDTTAHLADVFTNLDLRFLTHVRVWVSAFGNASGGEGNAGADASIIELQVFGPRVAEDDQATTSEQVPVVIDVLNNDLVADDSWEVSISKPPSNGTAAVNADGSIQYSPAPNFHGTDELMYSIWKEGELIDSATVSVIVEQINDAPIAHPTLVSTTTGTAVPLTLRGSDPEGDELEFIIVSPPSRGTLTGEAPNLTYVPNGSFQGADVLEFKVFDGSLASVITTVSVLVDANEEGDENNNPPNANTLTYILSPSDVLQRAGTVTDDLVAGTVVVGGSSARGPIAAGTVDFVEVHSGNDTIEKISVEIDMAGGVGATTGVPSQERTYYGKGAHSSWGEHILIKANGVVIYRILFDDVPGLFGDRWATGFGPTERYYKTGEIDVTGLDITGPVTLSIAADDGSVIDVRSVIVDLTVAQQRSLPPVPQFTATRQEAIQSRPSLVWSDVVTADRFEVVGIAKESGSVVFRGTAGSPLFSPSESLSKGDYWVWVRSLNQAGASEWSEPLDLKIDAPHQPVENSIPVINSLTSSANNLESKSTDGVVSIQGTYSGVGAANTHRVSVDWGDGSHIQVINVDQLADSFAGQHDYPHGGVYSIVVTVEDSQGGTASASTTATVAGVGVVDGTLYVIGSKLSDHVTLNMLDSTQLQIVAQLNQVGHFNQTSSVSSIDRIVAFLGDGNDSFMGKKIELDQLISGDDGDDRIVAGKGNDIVLGGNGNDRLKGKAGNDLVVAGPGSDKLVGNKGRDLLISGELQADVEIEGLHAALASWITGDLDDVFHHLGNPQDDGEANKFKLVEAGDELVQGSQDEISSWAIDKDKLGKQLEQHEGISAKVYLDTEGNPTIGIGFNLNRGDAVQRISSLGLDYQRVLNGQQELTNEQIQTLFFYDMKSSIAATKKLVDNFIELSDVRQRVLVDMMFNLGSARFATFEKMLAAVEAKDFDKAAAEMEDSTWYRQVKTRGITLVRMMKSDKDPAWLN